jgi:GNAT superfamily N-acetyltransferase
VIGFVLFATHQSVNGSPRIAQLGCFYVAREYRGKGIGEKLFNRAVEKERNRGTNLTLNAGTMQK